MHFQLLHQLTHILENPMSNINNSPTFPLQDQEPQHFTDYGFEPQIDYFQVLEEARKHRTETTLSSTSHIDMNFKLQKPMSRDEASKKIKKTKKRWWRNALLFFKFPRWPAPPRPSEMGASGTTRARHHIGSISCPVYITESMAGSPTPNRSGSRPGSGPLGKGGEIPYISLRELDVDGKSRTSAAVTPIYLVT